MVEEKYKAIIDSIISIFETGRPPSKEAYSSVTILRDGAGISYGKHQSTDRAGSLDAVLWKYIELGGAHSFALMPFLDRLKRDETVAFSDAPWVSQLADLLRAAGSDPVMHQAQDYVFDRGYWFPAVDQAENMGLIMPLSYAVVYDTCVHSGPAGVTKIRERFPELPPKGGGSEKDWTREYVLARREWLDSSSNRLVRNTTYRMDEFIRLMNRNQWYLDPPLVVRGVQIVDR